MCGNSDPEFYVTDWLTHITSRASCESQVVTQISSEWEWRKRLRRGLVNGWGLVSSRGKGGWTEIYLGSILQCSTNMSGNLGTLCPMIIVTLSRAIKPFTYLWEASLASGWVKIDNLVQCTVHYLWIGGRQCYQSRSLTYSGAWLLWSQLCCEIVDVQFGKGIAGILVSGLLYNYKYYIYQTRSQVWALKKLVAPTKITLS